jgi:hypothetical protein
LCSHKNSDFFPPKSWGLGEVVSCFSPKEASWVRFLQPLPKGETNIFAPCRCHHIHMNFKREKELILFLSQVVPGGITRTRLLKLLYLIDYYSKEKLKKKITNFSYDYYYYGPYSEQYILLLDVMKSEELLETTTITNDGNLIYSYGPVNKISKDYSSLKLFNTSEKEIIKSVINDFARLHFNNLLEKVYNTEPIKENKFGTKNVL